MPKTEKPNILVIWGDDIGITNLSCYSSGLMGYRTPNIDRLANEGIRFTDAYGEQSCTAGRSSFITGQSVYRTGLSKVGVPASPIGLQPEDPTIAELLKPLGYATGQFGKNHLGDLNKFLPTVHGFDEFFGNLCHLNCEEEPERANYPSEKEFPEFKKRYGPRGVIHSWATDKDDKTEQPRWGRVGRQRIEDTGPLTKKTHGDDRRRDNRSREGLHQAALDDRKAERANPDIAGRPAVVHGKTQLLFPGMRRIQENAVINTKNKSHSVTAEIEVPESGARGVIVAQGGSMGGWCLYAYQGTLTYFYNFLGMRHFKVPARSKLPAGTHQARMEFTYDGGGIGKGATIALYVDGQKIGAGRVERTHALFFSMDETLEVGCDVGEPVSEDYGPRDDAFNGTVKWVQIDIDAAAKDVDHMVGAEERFKVAMARQ
jgi:hypothetical protein